MTNDDFVARLLVYAAIAAVLVTPAIAIAALIIAMARLP
jgi:hypothetical protein